jgi:uncharacterized membrane protein YdfJ with MMPL/SSD domain
VDVKCWGVTTLLARFGRFMGRERWWVAAGWLALLIMAAPLAKNVTHNLSASGFEWPGSRAVWADSQLGHVTSLPGADPLLIEGAPYHTVTGWANRFYIPAGDWHRLPGGQAVIFPPAAHAPATIEALTGLARRHGAMVTDVSDVSVGKKVITDTKATLGSSLPVALPLLIVLLLLVFGTVVSALLPTVVAGAGSILALAVIDIVENHLTLSAYLTDIVSFLALGVGVDYALFISARYRQALERLGDRLDAVSEAMGHAGRSVLYSGFAVALALATLTLGGNAYWRGIALGGAVAVAAVLVATHTLLPAVLVWLGPRINWGKVPVRAAAGFWEKVAGFVRRHPGWAILVAVVILGVPGSQGPQIQMSTPANLAVLLPVNDPLRQAVFLVQRVRGAGSASPLVLVMELPERVTSPAAWTRLRTITDRVAKDAGVRSVVSPATFAPPAILAAALSHPALVPPALPKMLGQFVNPAYNPHLVMLFVTARTGPDSTATIALVHRLDRQLSRWLPGRRTGVGGLTALLDGFNRLTAQRLPWIMAAVAAVAFLVLLLATGSVWQALLGVAFDGLVALATAGLLVVTVQRGGIGLYPLQPDSGVTPLIFVLLFGLSMDYEVILLHRMQEFLRQGQPAADAAAQGVAATGGMITGAGMIMVVVFIALILSPLEIMKTLAIGMTAAILLDTWLVRSLLVPGSTVMLGRFAFWPWGRRVEAAPAQDGP